MKTLFKICLFVLLTSSTALAVPASEESIKQLLAVTQVQKLLTETQEQLGSMMDVSMQQALKGKTPSASEQEAIRHMKAKMTVLFQEELAWKKIEPMYIRLYQESFSEDEVTGMLSFYKTPAGQSVIHKLPVLTQKIMLEMQAMMLRTTPKMQQIMREFMAEITKQP